MTIAPLKEYSGEQVKRIRLSANMTQGVFAQALGVTKKAVEAWEAGHNRPGGAARRLISMMETDPKILERYGLLAEQAP